MVIVCVVTVVEVIIHTAETGVPVTCTVFIEGGLLEQLCRGSDVEVTGTEGIGSCDDRQRVVTGHRCGVITSVHPMWQSTALLTVNNRRLRHVASDVRSEDRKQLRLRTVGIPERQR